MATIDRSGIDSGGTNRIDKISSTTPMNVGDQSIGKSIFRPAAPKEVVESTTSQDVSKTIATQTDKSQSTFKEKVLKVLNPVNWPGGIIKAAGALTFAGGVIAGAFTFLSALVILSPFIFAARICGSPTTYSEYPRKLAVMAHSIFCIPAIALVGLGDIMLRENPLHNANKIINTTWANNDMRR